MEGFWYNMGQICPKTYSGTKGGTLKKIKFVLIVIFIVVLLAFLYLAYLRLFTPLTNTPPVGNGNQPTPNLTAVAEWTPTPNSPNQAEGIVATAWPTPVTRIMPTDRDAFRRAFLEKLTAEPINWTLLANLNHAGVAWRCSDIKLGEITLPASTSGTMVALWASWYGGVDNSTMTVSIEEGSSAPPVNNTTNNSIDIYKNAKVTINFPDYGLVGPEILQGNEVALTVEKPSILYGVWLTPREWITGEDLIGQKQNDNTNAALDWAKIDSIAPLLPDGSRDTTYLELLYNMTSGSLDPEITSIDLPNGTPVYLNHDIYQTLMKHALEAAKEAGFFGVESLVITVNKPSTQNDYVYLANHGLPVIPEDLALQLTNSTCPQVKLEPDSLISLREVNLPEAVFEGIVIRLLQITQE